MSTDARKKALEAALGQIERQYGKGSIMRMDGAAPPVKVDTISTGSLGLDIALGVGGLPRGRIVEIYGPESSGKCLTADTHVLSTKGMMTIEELFEMEGFKATCTSKIVPHTVSLMNEHGEAEETSHLTWNNRKAVVELQTSLGLTLRATHNHPVRVMDEHGFIVWRNAGDVTEGDTLVVMRGQQFFPANDMITRDEATLLGFLIADGANAAQNRVAFSNSDPDVIAEYTDIITPLLGDASLRSYPKSDTMTIDHHVNSKTLRADLAERLGLSYDKSKEKQVPLTVRTSGAAVQQAFLRAYFELECALDETKRSIEVTSASRLLLEQCQLMLLNFGFVGTLSLKTVQGTPYWRLTYSGKEGFALGAFLAFKSKARIEKFAAFAADNNGSPNNDSIPNLAGLLRSLYAFGDTRSRDADKLLGDVIGDRAKVQVTYTRLEAIVAFFDEALGTQGHPILTHLKTLLQDKPLFTKVRAIDTSEAPTFDVCLPKTHSFWSNGLVSHNTTLTLHVLAEAQKKGLVCAFVDAEHALDTAYAAKLGVDLGDLLISQPSTGEEGLNITETLARSGAVDVIVVDSVAALTPQKELEGDVGDSSVGVQARMMSQAMRKLTGVVSKNNVMVIFINQIRMKIGVMFGCFHYDARVLLADGTTEKIGKIVNQRMDVEVLSFNGQTGKIEPKKVVNWFDNGVADHFLHIQVSGGKSGRRHLSVTPNHTIFTPEGEVSAGDLRVGDPVLASASDFLFAGAAKQVLLGSILGDASVRLSKSKSRGTVRFGHGKSQADYALWKHAILQDACGAVRHNAAGNVYFDTLTFASAASLNAAVRLDGITPRTKQVSRQITADLVNQLEAPAFAVWYMDDGHFPGTYAKWGKGKTSISAKATNTKSLTLLADRIETLTGHRPTVSEKGLTFSAEAGYAFHTLIAPYVPACMDYKLHPSLRNQQDQTFGYAPTDVTKTIATVVENVVSITHKPPTRSMRKFDLEIEGNHSYLVDGVVVHNSPETTTGGNALKFYASVRLDIRRTGSVKDREEAIGNTTKVKVVKNKVAPPFKLAEFEIMFGTGISKLGEIIDLGVKANVVEKSGSWFSYGDERIGQGKEKAKETLRQNPAMADEIEAKIRDRMGLLSLGSDDSDNTSDPELD